VVNADAALTTDRPAVAANPLGDARPPDGGGLIDRRGAVLVGVATGLVVTAAAVFVLTTRRRRRRTSIRR
jgi:hypothetical protein